MNEKEATCPYCQVHLQQIPQRKSKCPRCSEPIHVKRPFGSPAGTKVLMTTAQAEAEEAKWNIRSTQKYWTQLLHSAGITADQFLTTNSELQHPDDGLTASQQLLMHVLNSSRDLQQLKMASLAMVKVAKKSGIDPMPFKESMYQYELEQLQLNGVKEVEVVMPKQTVRGPDSRTGEHCLSRVGKRFSIDTALWAMPVPCGLDCICQYSPIFDHELIPE